MANFSPHLCGRLCLLQLDEYFPHEIFMAHLSQKNKHIMHIWQFNLKVVLFLNMVCALIANINEDVYITLRRRSLNNKFSIMITLYEEMSGLQKKSIECGKETNSHCDYHYKEIPSLACVCITAAS